jgi:hypothetical protein
MLVNISVEVGGYVKTIVIDAGVDFSNINNEYILDCVINPKSNLSMAVRFVFETVLNAHTITDKHLSMLESDRYVSIKDLMIIEIIKVLTP